MMSPGYEQNHRKTTQNITIKLKNDFSSLNSKTTEYGIGSRFPKCKISWQLINEQRPIELDAFYSLTKKSNWRQTVP